MKACAAALAMLMAIPLQAETGTYLLEMHDELGRLVATHHLRLEFGPENARGTIPLSGALTADRVDDAYRYLLDSTERMSGSMHGPFLQLTLSYGVLAPLLKIEAVAIPDTTDAFQGRWKRFGCFHGASGTLTAWPINKETQNRTTSQPASQQASQPASQQANNLTN